MSIVIMGGTGSLGTHLLQYFYEKGEKIIVVSRDEQKQFILKERFPETTFLLGDIRCKNDICDAFRDTMGRDEQITLVINAAALKHVSIGEYNVFQSVKTNILGSKNIIDACVEFSIPTCVFVSTDKAVEPVNLYGKCKAVAENLFIQGNTQGKTRFVGVRYGNVINSNGSLIPFYQRCVQQRQPLLLTHSEMTRFFLTLKQAVHIIERACAAGTHRGTITIPKMISAKVLDIAQLYSEKYDLPIKIIGIKPGEKLHEILLAHTEFTRTEDYEDRYCLYDGTLLANFDKIKCTTRTSYASNDSNILQSKEEIKRILEIEGLL